MEIDRLSESLAEPLNVKKKSKTCSVPGCTNEEYLSPDVHFFPFPLDSERCLQWILMCNRRDLISESIEKLSRDCFICSVHFHPSCFVKNHKKLLKATSVPTSFIKSAPVFNKTQNFTHVENVEDLSNLVKEQTQLSCSGVNNTLSIVSNQLNLNTATETVNIVNEQCKITLNICRLCSESIFETENMLNIFDDSNISERINTCLPIKVDHLDALPRIICTNCYKRLGNHLEFHKIVIESDRILKDMFLDEDSTENMYTEEFIVKDLNISEQQYIITSVHNDHIYAEVVSQSNKAIDGSMTLMVSDQANLNNQQVFKIDDLAGDSFSPCDAPNSTENNLIAEHIFDKSCFQDKPKSFENNSSHYNESNEKCETLLKNNSMYTCNLCNVLTPDLESLFNHSVFEHSSGDQCFRCVLCHTLDFPTGNDLMAHMHNHQYSEAITKNDSGFEELPIENSTKNIITDNLTEPISNEHVELYKQQKNYYLCGICDKKFTSKQRLEFHLKFHLDEKPGICILCNKKFPNENLLYRHMWYLHGGGKESGKCGSKGTKSFLLKKSIGSGGKCSTCGKGFSHTAARLAHEEAQHSVKRQCYQCLKCNEAFSNTEQVSEHLTLEHGIINEMEIFFKLTTMNRLFQCEYCFKLFTKTSALGDHRFMYHIEQPQFCCRSCGEKFDHHEELLSHIANISEHSISHYKEDHPDRPVARKFFCCHYCSKMFQSLSSMMDHSLRHKEELENINSKDQKITITVGDIHQSNINSFTPEILAERIFKCKHCFKSFPNETSLIKHNRIHTGERPYQCDTCGKSFSQSSALTTHTKIHSDERPYSCRHCSQTFKIKGDKDCHERKHSGERPYKCDICKKSFMTQHVYSQHCKIHTNQRPYKCDICNEAFRRPYVLKVHLLRHSGEKPHACYLCDKQYRQRGDLLKHLKSQHGIYNCPKSNMKMETQNQAI